METKVCTKCKLEKPLDRFDSAAHTKDGRITRCKTCKAADRKGNKTGERVNRDVESLPNEKWVNIIGHEDLYQISNLGRVKSLERLVLDPKPITGFRVVKAAILKVTYSSHYPTVRLTKGEASKNHSMHILMWDHFGNEKRDGVRVVDHINNNKNDFRIENLQLVTHRVNTTKDRIFTNKRGATYLKDTGTWASRISYKCKKVELGCFKTEDEAHKRYLKALEDIEKGVFTIPTREEKRTFCFEPSTLVSVSTH